MVKWGRSAPRHVRQMSRDMIPQPRKRPRKPMKTCLNPEASVAGFIVAYCNCMICVHRRGKP